MFFTFSDDGEICTFNDGETKKFQSEFIKKYKDTSENMARSSEWKRGSNAAFRGEVDRRDSADLSFDSQITGVFPTARTGEVVYTFYIENASGIYRKDLCDEKLTETHVVNSNELTFSGGSLIENADMLATSVRRNYYNSDIAVFDLKTDDYKTVTGGDTWDDDPCFSEDNPDIIYYSSRGAGRNASGDFVEFSPAELYKLDLGAMDVEKVSPDDGYSYFKPAVYGGKLYCIKAPAKEKRGNPILEILLIPIRILQAFVGFLEVFVRAFTGKSMTGSGDNPTKGRVYDSRKIIISGNLVDVEKEIKKNKSKKDSDYGLVPKSWKLIELESGNVIKSGIADFDIADDGTIIATNGRRIFAIKDGKTEKLCNTNACFTVSCRHGGAAKTDTLFGF